MRLYYLTGPRWGMDNIQNKRLKVSRFHDLNDPFELLSVDITDQVLRPGLRAHKEKLNVSTGLICLSRSWSNPLMWGHYAEKHTGMALGFEVHDGLPVEVIYAKYPTKLRKDPKTGHFQINEEFVNRLLITKFFDWHYEEEWRIFVELNDPDPATQHHFFGFSKDFDLKEVILGPKCPLAIEHVEQSIHESGLRANVVKSRIAFSKFEVVTDRLKTPRR